MTPAGCESVVLSHAAAVEDAAPSADAAAVSDNGRLRRLRNSIDLVDDALVASLAARRWLVRRVARAKQANGIAARDAAREHAVHARAASLARRLGLPEAAAHALLDVAIADALGLQSTAHDLDQGGRSAGNANICSTMTTEFALSASTRWLRWLPPPARIAPLLHAVPPAARRRAVERALSAVLAQPVASGTLDFVSGRRLGVEITDLGLAWTLELQGERVVVVDAPADASVCGTATDLLLLASRLEDADTLFFQRRLMLTGDTELGLHLRNVLDRMPWESVPLGLRIVLHRTARLARNAREAHCACRIHPKELHR